MTFQLRTMLLTAGAAMALSAGAANAAKPPPAGPPPVVVPACNISDIVAAPTGSTCAGYFAGNVLSGSPADVTIQTTALNGLGLAGAPVQIEHLNLVSTSSLIDFVTPLYGVTYIGVHWGAGNGGPANGVNGGVTGFYRLNFAANANINQLFTNFASTNSGAVLFSTQAAPPPPGVPEPATWAMMIIGFGSAGSMIRRRRASATAV